MTESVRLNANTSPVEQAGLGSALMPNLFIIGASKCGTSALHAYLRLHPEIRMGDEKEPCFFVEQSELMKVWAVMAHRPVSHDWQAYLQNFAGGENVRYRGEGSTLYAMAPTLSGVPARIAAASPNAKLIYMVREPVRRTIGHYWQEAKEFHEKRPLSDAIREVPIYRDTSDYALQMQEYLKYFDRSQIYVVIAERLRTRRQEVMAGIFDWMGLSQVRLSDADLADRHVSPPTSRRERIPGVSAIRDSSLWARLREVLPSGLVSTLRQMGTKTFDKSEMSDAAARAWLEAYFAPRITQFEQMIGESIPEWRKAG